ncbi:MAG: DUF1330 domain-containing protein [SAR324 cluster bacterium]|nr:DUF1330 domain-containing protein [SAR324 cluster bacterium]
MSAYVIAKVTVSDMEQYKEYMKASPGVVEKYGGKFIVRGGEKITLEGPEVTERMVVVEFPTMEKAKEFYHSPEYTAARKLREGAAIGSFVALDGI